MATNQEEKPAKPRTRNRKASDQRNPKKAQRLSEQVKVEAEPVSAMTAAIEDAPVQAAPAEAISEIAPAGIVSDVIQSERVQDDVATVETAPEAAPVALALENAQEEKPDEKSEEKEIQGAVLNGEVLPPVRDAAPPAGLFAITHAYGEYTRKSWANGRFLVERLIAARSLDEAIEIQGEFAKQAYTNFIVQSERICVLYGEWALGLFRPLEKFATGWPQAGR